MCTSKLFRGAAAIGILSAGGPGGPCQDACPAAVTLSQPLEGRQRAEGRRDTGPASKGHKKTKTFLLKTPQG